MAPLSDYMDGPDILGVVSAPASTGREEVYGLMIPSPAQEELEVIPTADPECVIIAIPVSEMPVIVPSEGPIKSQWAKQLEGVFMVCAAALGRWLEDHPNHGA